MHRSKIKMHELSTRKPHILVWEAIIPPIRCPIHVEGVDVRRPPT